MEESRTLELFDARGNLSVIEELKDISFGRNAELMVAQTAYERGDYVYCYEDFKK